MCVKDKYHMSTNFRRIGPRKTKVLKKRKSQAEAPPSPTPSPHHPPHHPHHPPHPPTRWYELINQLIMPLQMLLCLLADVLFVCPLCGFYVKVAIL